MAKPTSPTTESDPTGPARLDRWLWAVRLFKTRGLAAGVCRSGVITINGIAAKPAREVRVGETVVWQDGLVTRTLIVKGHPRSRVGAKLVAGYCEETTPAAAWDVVRERRVEQFLARDKGAGRPTKRDRREIEQLFD